MRRERREARQGAREERRGEESDGRDLLCGQLGGAG